MGNGLWVVAITITTTHNYNGVQYSRGLDLRLPCEVVVWCAAMWCSSMLYALNAERRGNRAEGRDGKGGR